MKFDKTLLILCLYRGRSDLQKKFWKKKISKKLRDQAIFFIITDILILRNVLKDKLVKNVIEDYNKIINSKKYKKT